MGVIDDTNSQTRSTSTIIDRIANYDITASTTIPISVEPLFIAIQPINLIQAYLQHTFKHYKLCRYIYKQKYARFQMGR